MKNAVGILMGVVINVYIALGSMDILTVFVLPVHEHGMFFHIFVFLNFFHECSVVF